MKAEAELRLANGEIRYYTFVITPEEAASLGDAERSVSRVNTEFEIFDRLISADRLSDAGVIEFEFKGIQLRSHDSPAGQDLPRHSGVRRCHSVLNIAAATLPPGTRDEAVDEWMDEIECAAAENRPVLRRAISILIRSLPVLAWRSRLPSRVRRPGSQ